MDKISLTKKQIEIIKLIYRFRFLSRIQIQKLLNHKDSARVNKWLTALVEQNYLGRIYNKKDGKNRIPSIYYLDKLGIKIIKAEMKIKNSYLQKLINEEKISLQTKEHSLKSTDFYIVLSTYTLQNNIKLEYYTKSDLSIMPMYQYVKPDAYFVFESTLGKKNAFIEIDLETESKATFRKKIMKYIDFYYTFKWKTDYSKTFPLIDIVCITDKRVKDLIIELEKLLEKYNYIPITFRLTTFIEIGQIGISAQIWKMPFERKVKYKII